MGESYGDTQYVLVLKDELTHYCELIACDAPTSSVMAAAILDWAKRFGLPAMWVSDNATHIKNKLMENLRDHIKALHTFVPVYTPWVNETVERFNRDILQVMRALLLKHQLDTKSWEHLLPLVQANLNQTPVNSLGGKAPVELFTALKVPTQVDTVLLPRSMQDNDKLMQINMETDSDDLKALRESLQAMHQEVRLRGNKLIIRWVGPYRVTEAREYSFIVEHLLTGGKFEVHGSRLKFYVDASMNVNEEILEHVAKQGIVLAAECIRDHPYNPTAKQWELLVSWHGLQEIEDSWEPFTSMLRDVPGLVEAVADSSLGWPGQSRVCHHACSNCSAKQTLVLGLLEYRFWKLLEFVAYFHRLDKVPNHVQLHYEKWKTMSEVQNLDRCYVHPISKYPEAEMNVDTAEEMIMTTFNSDNHEEVLCPCGKATKR
ncbi:unnamed protein product [Phytophthora lilii]|uniref:Unnamed protein product n=1 Tax=Phytophthora lilii TaxID=2077276 RepID=A0A9W6U0M9_9STRA|nr:unnamed protein product [Phytophthora lilii]